MSSLSSRADFILRDPAALGALLDQDWRIRNWVTDEEVVDELVDHPVTTSLLRHLQRLGLIRAHHGVRQQGGRMRLWAFSDVFKVQVVLDLKAHTRLKLSSCVDALLALGDSFDRPASQWRTSGGPEVEGLEASHISTDPDTLLHDRTQLEAFVHASIRKAVLRCRFSDVERPTFLL